MTIYYEITYINIIYCLSIYFVINKIIVNHLQFGSLKPYILRFFSKQKVEYLRKY